MLVCDGLRLKRRLRTTLSNALKFREQRRSPAGSGAPGRKLQFHVIDTGPGNPGTFARADLKKFARQRAGQVNMAALAWGWHCPGLWQS